MKKTGLYIHIPFCVKKCNYCAFLSFRADEDVRRQYANALMKEIALAGEKYGGRRIDTVYLGGGTPSVMDVALLSLIMKTVRRSFDVSEDAEITIEANPGTLGIKDRVVRAKLTAYRYMGINRLSMGVQSMDNNRLALLGRIHTAEDVARDFAIAREMGFDNINLDLIFSVPGESTEDALSDARRIIGLGPEHISCYSLQLEEGTPFYEMAERGEISEIPDEEDRDTYHRIIDLLRKSGYEHYEISNFARMIDSASADNAGKAPGFVSGDGRAETADAGITSPYRSRHNSLYWNLDDYIGVGLGASGFVDGVRYRNTSDMKQYMDAYGGAESRSPGEPVFCREEEHVNTDFDNTSEAVFTGLRRREGITYRDVTDAFWDIFADVREEAERFAGQGLLVIGSDGMRLTETGVDVSNAIMALFV